MVAPNYYIADVFLFVLNCIDGLNILPIWRNGKDMDFAGGGVSGGKVCELTGSNFSSLKYIHGNY